MVANFFGRSLFPAGFIFKIVRFLGGEGGGGSWGHLLLFFEIFQRYDICVFFHIFTPED